MLKDLCSKPKDLSSVAARDSHQLSKARVIGSEDVACLGDERQLGRRNAGHYKEPALRTTPKGRGIEVISLGEGARRASFVWG